jgi:hypothetical protein
VRHAHRAYIGTRREPPRRGDQGSRQA